MKRTGRWVIETSNDGNFVSTTLLPLFRHNHGPAALLRACGGPQGPNFGGTVPDLWRRDVLAPHVLGMLRDPSRR